MNTEKQITISLVDDTINGCEECVFYIMGKCKCLNGFWCVGDTHWEIKQ